MATIQPNPEIYDFEIWHISVDRNSLEVRGWEKRNLLWWVGFRVGQYKVNCIAIHAVTVYIRFKSKHLCMSTYIPCQIGPVFELFCVIGSNDFNCVGNELNDLPNYINCIGIRLPNYNYLRIELEMYWSQNVCIRQP